MAAHPSTKAFVVIWALLLFLLALTRAAAALQLGRWNIVLALTIAVIKMMLVVLFFMQVRYGTKITWAFVAAGFLWLFFMLTLTFADYTTRRRFHPWRFRPFPSSSSSVFLCLRLLLDSSPPLLRENHAAVLVSI